MPSRFFFGLRLLWFIKCQLKQVNGLWAVHLCCRNSGHWSTRNSFRYLRIEARKKIVTRSPTKNATQKQMTKTPTCNGRAFLSVAEKSQLIYYLKKRQSPENSLQPPQTTCCFGNVKNQTRAHHNIDKPWRFMGRSCIPLVKGSHVTWSLKNWESADQNKQNESKINITASYHTKSTII